MSTAVILDLWRDVRFDRVSMYNFLLSFPSKYKEWWLTLYREAPLHIVIETTLLVFVLWLLFIRRTVDPAKLSDSKKFTEKEVKWLVDSWEPEPLVPTVDARGARRVAATKTVCNHLNERLYFVSTISYTVINSCNSNSLSFYLRVNYFA